MRKISGWVMAPVALLALVGPAFAADTSATPPSSPQPAHPVSVKTRHLVGEVVSVDASGKTITVKQSLRNKMRETTLTVGPDATATLADLKPGDHVKIAYVTDHGHLTAKSIENEPAAKK